MSNILLRNQLLTEFLSKIYMIKLMTSPIDFTCQERFSSFVPSLEVKKMEATIFHMKLGH